MTRNYFIAYWSGENNPCQEIPDYCEKYVEPTSHIIANHPENTPVNDNGDTLIWYSEPSFTVQELDLSPSV